MKYFTSIIAVVFSLMTCTAQTSKTMENKVLVAYFSATGTTKAQAEAIADATGATLYEITPATKYTDADLDWRNQKSRSSVEMKDEKSRPMLGGKKITAADYDIIFIGYPIWWDLCPRVVNTWIESQQLKGKTVIPFATSGGSSISNSQNTLRKLYPDCNWQDGKLLNGSAKSAGEWANTIMANAQNIEIKQTAGRQQLGEFAPEFARLNDDVLFGEVWNRQEELSLHDRSIVTVLSLVAQGITDSSLQYHLQSAKDHGVTRDEIAETLTHAAFYIGWPKAWATFRLAKEVWKDEPMSREAFECITDYPIGEPNTGFAQYFVGNSYLAPMDAANGGPINVTFEPGCRNNWHIHHGAVQVLICVAGRGWYQEWGKEPVELKPGVTIAIPEGVKHWHGASSDSWMQHLTYETKVEAKHSNEWLEPVNADDYNKLK